MQNLVSDKEDPNPNQVCKVGGSVKSILVECKTWVGNRYRLSALKKAIEQHKERTTFYEDITQVEAIPIIVTLIEEEIHVYEGVPIVPVLKLDGFIGELDNHLDGEGYCIFEEEILLDEDMEMEAEEFF